MGLAASIDYATLKTGRRVP